MVETRYTETLALLAVMNDDEDEALRILDEDMMPGERRTFMGQLNRLSVLADDRVRCPHCNRPAGGLGDVMARNRHWHLPCLSEQREIEARQ